MKNKYSHIYAILLLGFFQLPLYAELVIDIGPDKKEKKPAVEAVQNKNVTQESKADIIKFKNKDMLHGTMISFEPNKGILWKTNESLRDILFSVNNVKGIELGNYYHSKGDNASVLLTNGDTLGGKLVSLDKETLLLDTFYGGKMKINRHMVQSIFPGANNPGILYSGPNDLAEWIIPEGRSGGKIEIQDETLSMTGFCSIGRDMKLTEMSKVDFSFEIAGNCQLQVLFFCNKSISSPHDCYSLYLSSGYIYLQRYGQHGRSGNLGNVNSRDLRAGKGKVTLLLDKKNKKFTLLVNDAMVKQWIDTQDPMEGTFLCFNNQSQGTIKIRDLEISQWNGKIPGGTEVKENENKDVIIFVNGDQVTGKLQSIEQNVTVFKTEYAELKIPLQRIKQLQTAAEKQHRARRNAGDVRFSFVNGDQLTLDLAKIDNGKIVGKSENFGKVSLNQNAFKAIVLNIYSDEEEE